MGWGKGKRPAGEGVRRGWCVVAMETPSPSLIIIWGKMARGLLPRVTPSPPFLLTLLSLSLPYPCHRGGSSASSSASTSPSFYVLHHVFFSSATISSSCFTSSTATASSMPSTSHPASPHRLIAPRHLLCPPREYYAYTLPGRLCNHP